MTQSLSIWTSKVICSMQAVRERERQRESESVCMHILVHPSLDTICFLRKWGNLAAVRLQGHIHRIFPGALYHRKRETDSKHESATVLHKSCVAQKVSDLKAQNCQVPDFLLLFLLIFCHPPPTSDVPSNEFPMSTLQDWLIPCANRYIEYGHIFI